jgi:hypothetical protein
VTNPFTQIADTRAAEGHKALARRIRTEGKMCGALVQALLDRGATVSVNDGEEWVVKRSTDKATIIAALFSTDEDQLVARDAEGNRLGWFHLVYGNDGTDVLSDYSANDYCEAIWTEVIQPLADGIDEGRIRV